MSDEGPLCHCGKRGCLETYVGDSALLRYAGRDETPTFEHVDAVFAAARSGDASAVAAVRRVATALGHGVAALVNTIDPHRVIFGGSLSQVLALAEDDVVTSLGQYVFAGGPAVELAQPGLDGDSSLLGAAEIAFETLLADPLSVR
jgi:predicted NBD/HSP70 family sugar kinase